MALNVFKKFTEGLQKTKEELSNKLDAVFSSFGKVDASLFDELEDILISSDIGVESTIEIIDYLKKVAKAEKIKDPADIKLKLKEHIKSILNIDEATNDEELPYSSIILIVGVNGVGKTTTIGKLAHLYKSMGEKVIVAAGDTFRAAAVEQLQIWCQKSGVDIIANKEGSDPAAVIFDAVQAAKARNANKLICDTAGRLHNKKNLMNELNKIFRVVEKEYEKNQIKVYLVIDATTGQNGIIQAKAFNEAVHIDGIILTKLDGTAKGGIVIPIQKELKVPIKYVGLGEKIDDLQSFDYEKFVDAIFD
ncbi:MAG: signal recognition particle-docking protein FtsY [Tissierellales bacterium]|jgi:fused signal recognition particle receptor|nr:signal recognition particle-docking protein FtsY [Tissierellales bacterium]MBN2826560.1 signal recognition particle-docking protein FtsY [Tissierellales bacterium]